MKVLVIGKGGREHAIVRTLKKFDDDLEIFCAPGNGGTEIDASNINISELDSDGIKQFCLNNEVDFVIVTPDNPLANGMVDVLTASNILCFGPTKQAAKIEWSKVFAKNLMKKYGIPTAEFSSFSDPTLAIKYIKEKDKFPVVIKADGLAYGKGVFIANDFNESVKFVDNLMVKKQFADSAKQIVVEEFLEGTEASILCFTDGTTIKPLVSCLDHKKAFDFDRGPNTGGMGAVAPNFAYSDQVAKDCVETIFKPTIAALNSENCPFCGCLYFGLMITQNGPKVVEYNCRFGDPETQAILPLLQSNLLEVLMCTSLHKLNEIEIQCANKKSACVILTSKGYPNKFETNFEIKGLKPNGQLAACKFEGVEIFHSGTVLKNGKFFSSSGRVLSVVATADSLKLALEQAYAAANTIEFENKFCRLDIGSSCLDG